ncbi:MAG: rhodanese-related sulfurtransferase [Paracoccaceae bacterium]
MSKFKILSFYAFINIADLRQKAAFIKNECEKNKITGLVILAKEGINGTLSGLEKNLHKLMDLLTNEIYVCEMNVKESFSKIPAFARIKVKIKKEIVTFGVDDISSYKQTGQYIEPSEWNDLISKDDIITIDTRNDYEVRIGSFKGSINPKMRSFREFPKWWKENKEKIKGKSIAMFCTGGIRCEKSTKYLLKDGVKNVYHLRGGILNYLKSKEKINSLWEGECFVFDQRVSVDEDLNKGKSILCYACRIPLEPKDLINPKYEEGVSCPQCYNNTNNLRKNSFRERQKQIRLAFEKGEKHLKHF